MPVEWEVGEFDFTPRDIAVLHGGDNQIGLKSVDSQFRRAAEQLGAGLISQKSAFHRGRDRIGEQFPRRLNRRGVNRRRLPQCLMQSNGITGKRRPQPAGRAPGARRARRVVAGHQRRPRPDCTPDQPRRRACVAHWTLTPEKLAAAGPDEHDVRQAGEEARGQFTRHRAARY